MTSPYFSFPLTDGSRICVQEFERLHQIPNLQADNSIPVHAHEFYEMVLILRGSCRHIYRDAVTTLLPGDLFLIAPHRSHGYRFGEDVHHCNCQFFVDSLPSEWLDDIRPLTYDQLQKNAPGGRFPGAADINSQGILHLDRYETSLLRVVFDSILQEQVAPHADSERMKRCLLQLALARLTRVRAQQFANAGSAEQWKQQMIGETLARFEQRLSGEWDTAAIAGEYHISVSYFRSIFKEITGLPPRQYLNRMRIVHAVDLIQHHGASLIDAAQAIGISDLNYFSRLCRLITGYSPSHFRHISQ